MLARSPFVGLRGPTLLVKQGILCDVRETGGKQVNREELQQANFSPVFSGTSFVYLKLKQKKNKLIS